MSEETLTLEQLLAAVAHDQETIVAMSIKIAELEAELDAAGTDAANTSLAYAQLEAENEALKEFVEVVRKNDYWVEWCKLKALLTGESGA